MKVVEKLIFHLVVYILGSQSLISAWHPSELYEDSFAKILVGQAGRIYVYVRFGNVPACDGADGFKLTEGARIALYRIAPVDQWMHFSEQEIGEPNYNILGVIYGISGPSIARWASSRRLGKTSRLSGVSRQVLDKQAERPTYVETVLAKSSSSG
ncbi:hypothetical protein EV363DRAFT_1229007 [Boletus edulis]|nr:hypothetical protein EV363DRAFT_1229007 [Boletus edulis]